MSSTTRPVTQALDNVEACTTRHLSPVDALGISENLHDVSFSPICHRTRRQLANREPIITVPSLVTADSVFESQIENNELLEQEVVDILDDILNHIPPRALPGDLLFDESSPVAEPRSFIQDDDILPPATLHWTQWPPF
ncbi:hypothetical protein CDAR_68521 [Caerostris darwini]|uniref:Uncharacterized protein n=1 Tax=Caerostris darwini TaxID=1538125 RepID=A0AAV4PNL9_9ARAC|nr:hypothetical protein CDAR_68521 [Caerostris darwini]